MEHFALALARSVVTSMMVSVTQTMDGMATLFSTGMDGSRPKSNSSWESQVPYWSCEAGGKSNADVSLNRQTTCEVTKELHCAASCRIF